MSINVKNPGTYALWFRCHIEREVIVGRLGALTLHPGGYLYVGSAMGAGGLRARVARHARSSAKAHWHIDYIKPYLELEGAWMVESKRRLEHRWVKALQALPPLAMPQRKFGASDSNCESHLFYTEGHVRIVDKQLRETSNGEEVIYCNSEQLQTLFSG